jgi:ABC-type nitrate/sulfonate/bicarbonate transport system substrate-binding protein
VALLGAVHAARYLGGLGLSPGAVAVLDWTTSISVTLFLVTGALQLVLVARGVERRQETVAASAAALEDSAAAVEEAADEVEAVAEETPDPETVVERAESAKETAEAVERTVDEVRAELEPDDRDGDGARTDER